MLDLTLFNYRDLPADTASEIRAATERIKLRMKRTAEDIIAIGQDLLSVKERLPHGQFGGWLLAEFEMSERTAQQFMQVAVTFGGKSATVADLSTRALYALAAPSTPEPVRQEVIQRVEAGESVDLKEIARLKAEAKAAKEAAESLEDALVKSQHQVVEHSQHISRLNKTRDELTAKIFNLESLPPETVEVVREVIPEGFASVQDAINAAKVELAKVNAEHQDVQIRINKLQHAARVHESEAARAKASQQKMFGLKHDVLSILSRNNAAELLIAAEDLDDIARQDLTIALDALRALVQTVEDVLQPRPIAINARCIDV